MVAGTGTGQFAAKIDTTCSSSARACIRLLPCFGDRSGCFETGLDLDVGCRHPEQKVGLVPPPAPPSLA